MKGRVDKSREMENRITDTSVKIKPTDPLRFESWSYFSDNQKETTIRHHPHGVMDRRCIVKKGTEDSSLL